MAKFLTPITDAFNWFQSKVKVVTDVHVAGYIEQRNALGKNKTPWSYAGYMALRAPLMVVQVVCELAKSAFVGICGIFGITIKTRVAKLNGDVTEHTIDGDGIETTHA